MMVSDDLRRPVIDELLYSVYVVQVKQKFFEFKEGEYRDHQHA